MKNNIAKSGNKPKREVKDRAQRPYVMIDAELISILKPLEFITYAQIKRRAGGDGECWESLEHMARETSMSVASLKRSIKTLLQLNLIGKEKRPGETDLYALNPPHEWRLQMKKVEQVADSDLPTQLTGSYHPAHRELQIRSLELDPKN